MYTFSNRIKHIFVTSTATPSSLWPSLHLVWGAVLIISYNIGGTGKYSLSLSLRYIEVLN